MTGFDPIAWLAIVGVGAGAAVGMLHIVAVRIRNDREMAELRDRARDLRRRHEERLGALRAGMHLVGEEAGDVIVVDEAPAPEAGRAA